jgi:5-formyltetrahydrofolate cyclo-ligase
VSDHSKAALRADLLAARRSRSDREAADAGVRAALALLAADLDTVAGYVPLPNEPGGALLPDVLASACRRLLVPLLLPDKDLSWAVYRGQTLDPEAITSAELVVVPAVAVDRTGVRLGRGGGSYDRALTRVGPGTLIAAVLYPEELVERLPAEPHDVRVHAVVTPDGLTRL